MDAKLANHDLIKMIRLRLGLAGKKGKIPLPAKEGELPGSPGDSKGRIRVGLRHVQGTGRLEAGAVIPKLFEPNVSEGGTEWYTFAVDPEDTDNFVGFVQSFCRKHGEPDLPPDRILRLRELVKERPDLAKHGVKVSPQILWRGELEKADPNVVAAYISVDRARYKRAVVKIAYELACEWLGPAYLDDATGEKLRRFIMDPSFTTPPEQNAITGRVSINPAATGSRSLDSTVPLLTARMCFGEHSLVCVVNVFNMIHGEIVVTDVQEAYRLFIPRCATINPVTGGCQVRLLQGVVLN